MKKTINISLGGYSFTVEEDAYEKLDNYIQSLKKHFASFTDSEEIVSDIESRLAEQLNLKLKEPKIVNLPTVEELIVSMGSPEQFEGSENPKNPINETSASSFADKKMFRNPDDVVIAGVSSGIAAYFGIDTIWIRLLFVLLTLGSGFGVLLYIVLWVALPEAKTGTEKIQMRGEPVNLKNVEAAVKERVEEFKKKDKSKAKQILTAPFILFRKLIQAIGLVLKNLLPFLGRLVGAVLSLAGGLILAGLIFIALNLLFNASSPYLDFPLNALATGWVYFTAVLSAFFALLVPTIFLLMFGISLASLKPAFGKVSALLLFSLFIISISVFGSMAFKLAPELERAYQNSEYSRQETKLLDLKDFSHLESSNNYEITVLPSTEYKITAVGTASDLAEMQAYVKDGSLTFSRKGNFKICILCFNKPIKIEVSSPALQSVKASGASKVWANGFVSKDFSVKLSGASKAYLNLNSAQINSQLSGASFLELRGTYWDSYIKLSGASTADLKKAQVQNLNAELSGASKVFANDLNQIAAKLSGASRLYYNSVNTITKEETSGSSRIIVNHEPTKPEAPGLPATTTPSSSPLFLY